MASIMKELVTGAPLPAVWDAMRAVDELHTRLVPGFVTDTELDGDARIVTFASGAVVREPIVTISDELHRVAWTLDGGTTSHFNGAVQATAQGQGTRVVWTADFLPDHLYDHLDGVMTDGIAAMRAALDRLAAEWSTVGAD